LQTRKYHKFEPFYFEELGSAVLGHIHPQGCYDKG